VTEHFDRPWGSYTVLAEAADFKVKTIEVHPGQRLSYQRHSRRSEHWFVVGGEGVVTSSRSSTVTTSAKMTLSAWRTTTDAHRGAKPPRSREKFLPAECRVGSESFV
jgi:Mannose-6-phosphate isomerase